MDTVAPPVQWTADAGAYDGWFDQPWGRHAVSVEHRLLLDAAGPLRGRVVLDAGCGTGRFMHRLDSEAAAVIGVDRDPEALASARTHTNGPLVLADAHRLPIADRSVDVAFTVTVCEFAADPERVIAELARVTGDNGRIVVGSLNRNSAWGWWNRRQFTRPPWSTARFLDRRTLLRLGAPYGHCSLRARLYAPRVLAGITHWSPTLEPAASRATPTLGAFQVLTIQRPPHPDTPQRPKAGHHGGRP